MRDGASGWIPTCNQVLPEPQQSEEDSQAGTGSIARLKSACEEVLKRERDYGGVLEVPCSFPAPELLTSTKLPSRALKYPLLPPSVHHRVLHLDCWYSLHRCHITYNLQYPIQHENPPTGFQVLKSNSKAKLQRTNPRETWNGTKYKNQTFPKVLKLSSMFFAITFCTSSISF